MKKVLRIGIASYEEMKAYTMAVVAGKYKPGPDDPKIWFTAGSFAKILSEENRALLQTISQNPPRSLAELAKRTGRQKSNLSRTLRTMERFKLVVLKKGRRGVLIPEVPYTAISLVLPLTKAA